MKAARGTVCNVKPLMPITALIGVFYAAIIAFIHPLVYHDYYFDINRCKYYYFLSFTCLAFCVCTTAYFADRKGRRNVKFQVGAPMIYLAAFILINVVGCFAGPYAKEALIGENGRYCGLVFLLTIGVMSAIVSFSGRGARISASCDMPKLTVICTMIAGVLCAILGICNYMGVDPLGFFTRLPARYSGSFISTIGNRNFFSAYLCLAVPMAASVFMACDGKQEITLKVLSGSAFFLGTMAMYCARSDSGWIGLGVCAIALALKAFKSKALMRKFLILATLFFAAGYLLRVIMLLRYAKPLTGAGSIAQFLLKGRTLAAALIISTMLLCLWIGAIENRVRDNGNGILKPLKLAIIVIMITVAVAAAFFTVYCTMNPQNVALVGIGRYFRLDDGWGSGRMRIWKQSLKIFANAPLSQKLFGMGPDTTVQAFSDAIVKGVINPTKRVIDASHNEYLNYLLTSGILGLLAYAAFVTSSIISLGKSPNFFTRAVRLACVAYAAQAFFNIAQPITAPLFILALSVRDYDDNRDAIQL